MFSVVMCFVFLVLAILGPKLIPAAVRGKLPGFVPFTMRVVFGLLALFLAAGTSIIHVPANQVGHLTKIYGVKSLENGRVVAVDGEKGFQAQTIPPGTHFMPFVTVINKFETFPMVTVPPGYYGRITIKDGQSLDGGEILAQAWNEAEYDQMLNAEHFLKTGGQKGLQASVLKPGTYPLNLYLYNVRIGMGETEDIVYDAKYEGGVIKENTPLVTTITQIPAGHVGVVKSNIQERGAQCRVIDRSAAGGIEGALSVKLVPRGCRGIWIESIQPGNYYLNRDAYEITLVDTRVQTWEYKGGFEKRYIDLAVDQAGNITQSLRKVDVPVEKAYADPAVMVKVEGWDVPQELRALVQVTPENAPVVVASVGGLKQIEDSVLTPSIRSIVRNVAGGTVTYEEDGKKITRSTRVSDLINNREILERNVEQLIRIEGMKAGVDIKEIRFGEPAIPPELLVAYQREQLAGQLKRAYQEEQKAQTERQATEQARATAEQQKDLVRAQIDVQRAAQLKLQRQSEGEAEKIYLELVAAGQREQANVLGKENVLMLNLAKEVLATLKEKPELVSVVGKLVPQVYVGNGGGLDSAAGIFGTLLNNPAVQAPKK